MSETKILVPYDEYTAMVKDSADLASIAGLLLTDFPDNTSQILAIKSVLGMVPEKEEPVVFIFWGNYARAKKVLITSSLAVDKSKL